MQGFIVIRRSAAGQQSLHYMVRVIFLLTVLYAQGVTASIPPTSKELYIISADALQAGAGGNKAGQLHKNFLEQLCGSPEWREYAQSMRAEEQLHQACENRKASDATSTGLAPDNADRRN